jgi:DNA-binding LacI/PurR family transcriptional regulator
VLNNKLVMPIPERTVDRIRRAAHDLNYVPNRLARALATRRTHTLGFYSLEITDPHGAALLDTVQSEARRRGYQVVVSSHLESVAAVGHADGVILFRAPDPISRSTWELPVVHVYPSRKPLPNTIGWCDYDAARDAACYLASLGHRVVAGIYGAAAPDKQPGFAEGAAAAGLELLEYLELTEPLAYESQAEYVDFFLGSGYRLTRKMLAENPRATAVFVRNDVLAAGALQALRDACIEVPGRISVLSYNDSLLAACAAPPLTSIRTPVREAGRLAVQQLIQAIEGGEPKFPGILVPTSLVVRASTGPAPD